MKPLLSILFGCFLVCSVSLYSQTFKLDKNKLEAINSSMSIEKLMGKEVVKVIKDSAVSGSDQPTYAKLKDIEFKKRCDRSKTTEQACAKCP